jgi:hypothetical protein
MNAFFSDFYPSTKANPHKRVLFLLFSFFLFFPLFFLFGCSKEVDYFSYVSELRNNVFLAQNETFSLRIFSVLKETPYEADGIPKEISHRAEFYLSAPSGDKDYELSFTLNEKTYTAALSYDNVKGEYYYFQTLDISEFDRIDCTLVCDNQTTPLFAQSVKTKTTLSPRDILDKVKASEPTLFSSLTDKYGFAGEIYLRLLYEDAPYYYVGIIDRNGNASAFLLNGETGKILAKRNL